MSDVYFFPFLRFGACVKADAATDLTAFDDFGLLNSFDAFEATRLDVCSFRFAAMVNPFRKSLVTGISNPIRSGLTTPMGIDPDDERIPIGPTDVISMHRHGAIVPKAPLPVNDQTLIRPLNVVVGRLVIKGSVGQVNGLIKQFLCDFFSHRRMMQRVHGWINPKFSRVNILSHAANVAPGYANKNVRGAAI